jgi:hypothetical protein
MAQKGWWHRMLSDRRKSQNYCIEGNGRPKLCRHSRGRKRGQSEGAVGLEPASGKTALVDVAVAKPSSRSRTPEGEFRQRLCQQSRMKMRV